MLCSLGWPQIRSVAEDDLELRILWTLSSYCLELQEWAITASLQPNVLNSQFPAHGKSLNTVDPVGDGT